MGALANEPKGWIGIKQVFEHITAKNKVECSFELQVRALKIQRIKLCRWHALSRRCNCGRLINADNIVTRRAKQRREFVSDAATDIQR